MSAGRRSAAMMPAALLLVAGASPGIAPHAAAAAQAVATPVGDWTGTVNAGGLAVRILVHVTAGGGTLAGTLDSPDQGATGLPLAEVSAQGDDWSFALPIAGGRFAGHWDAAARAYAGTWTQGGASLPLVLTRGGPATAAGGRDPVLPATAWRYTPAPAAAARTGPALPVGKCINMSDMLDAPTEGAWGPGIVDGDFPFIARAGFATVRIPVRWATHMAASAPYTIDPAFLARVRHVVDRAGAAGLNVILNDHNDDALIARPAAERARFAALWRQVGARFADAGPGVWFELLNEPHDQLDDGNLGEVLAPALAAVRASNPRRPVLIGGQNWSGLASLATLRLPDDPYVVPTFHYYDPFAFTHQGASWTDRPPPFGRRFGTAADKAGLDRDVATLAAYMARTGRVPVLGEYGAQDDPRVPLAERVRYYGAVSGAFASIGVQGCAWGYRTGFRLRDGRGWLPGMVAAIRTTR